MSVVVQWVIVIMLLFVAIIFIIIKVIKNYRHHDYGTCSGCILKDNCSKKEQSSVSKTCVKRVCE